MEDSDMYLDNFQLDSSDAGNSETDDSAQNFQVKISDQNMTKQTLQLPNNTRNSYCHRLPTRQPNPSVYNRNALLARENRRKKKAHLEILEKDLQEAIKTNNKLLKELSKQIKIVKKLQQEKLYYKSVLIKQPKIERLLAALNCRLDHNSKYNINFDYDQQELLNIAAGAHDDSIYSQHSSSVYEQEGSVSCLDTPHLSGAEMTIEHDLFLSSCQSSSNISDESFTYSDPFSFFNNDWNDIFEIKNQSTMENIYQNGEQVKAPISNNLFINDVRVSDEHNYVSSDKTYKSSEDIGFCVHIGEDKVTLDFCSRCHLNARRASNNLLES